MDGKKLKGKLQSVDIDYEAAGTPPAVKELKALVYKEGHTYFAWSGTSQRDVCYGFGDTAQEAMDDFQRNYSQKTTVKKEVPKSAEQVVVLEITAVSLKEKLFAHLPFFSENSAATFIERLFKKRGDPA